jgi:hypothetical protein
MPWKCTNCGNTVAILNDDACPCRSDIYEDDWELVPEAAPETVTQIVNCDL